MQRWLRAKTRVQCCCPNNSVRGQQILLMRPTSAYLSTLLLLLMHGLQAEQTGRRGLHTWVARYLGMVNRKTLRTNWKASTCPANPVLYCVLHQSGLVLHHCSLLFCCALRSLEVPSRPGTQQEIISSWIKSCRYLFLDERQHAC